MKPRLLLLSLIFLLYSINCFSWTKGGVSVLTDHVVSDDGRYFIYFNDGTYVFDVDSQKVVNQFQDFSGSFANFATYSDKHLLGILDLQYRPYFRLSVYNFITSELLLRIDSIGLYGFGDVSFADSGKTVSYFDPLTMIVSSWKIPSKIKKYDTIQGIDPKIARIGGMAMSHDGTRISYCLNDSLYVRELKTDSIITRIKLKSSVFLLKRPPNFYKTNFKFGNKNNIIAFVDSMHYIRIYDTDKRSYIMEIFEGVDYFFPYLQFTSNMEYVIATKDTYPYATFSRVWKISDGKEIDLTKSSEKYIVYMSDDGAQAIELKPNYYRCGLYDAIPYESYYYELFSVKDDSVKTVLPEGFAGSDSAAVILSPDGRFLAAFGKNLTNVSPPSIFLKLYDLVDNSSAKSIKLKLYPIAFTPDSKYLLFLDSNKIIFHDIWADIDKDSIVTDLKKITNVAIDPKNNVLICHDDITPEIYNLNNNSLILKILLGGKNSQIKLCKISKDGIVNIITSDYNMLSYDLSTQQNTNTFLKSLQENNGVPLDLSNDSKYLLFTVRRNYYNIVIVWDIENNKQIYIDSNMYEYNGDPQKKSVGGFLKVPYLIYTLVVSGYYTLYHQTLLINLQTKQKLKVNQYNSIVVAPDSLHFAAGGCPGLYYYEPIPPELFSDVGVNDDVVMPECVSVYPNPARDRIFIKPGNNIVNPVVVVYNLQGERVEAPIMANLNNLEISTIGLPSGMYFVRIANGGEVLTKSFVVER